MSRALQLSMMSELQARISCIREEEAEDSNDATNQLI